MNLNMKYKTFSTININDKFFDSLKADYPGFEKWYESKHSQYAYVQYDENQNIIGFLYLKIETELVADVSPNIKANKILKVGTFKIDAHGTRLGERFIKLITDYAVSEDVDVCYVTIFPKHASLINLVTKFGFFEYGTKGSSLVYENVYVKDMRSLNNDIIKDFPLINTLNTKKYLLSVQPRYHSVMFPDSILCTENKNILDDVSFTNSIHKIYICSMGDTYVLKQGDIIVVYRTTEDNKQAEYCSVATSICVVEETLHQSYFKTFDEYYKYTCQYSVFNKDDLHKWYKRGNCRIIKFTYNIALNKRIIRHDLIEKIGLSRNNYWGFFELSDSQFKQIAHAGQINFNILK